MVISWKHTWNDTAGFRFSFFVKFSTSEANRARYPEGAKLESNPRTRPLHVVSRVRAIRASCSLIASVIHRYVHRLFIGLTDARNRGPSRLFLPTIIHRFCLGLSMVLLRKTSRLDVEQSTLKTFDKKNNLNSIGVLFESRAKPLNLTGFPFAKIRLNPEYFFCQIF